MRWLWSLEGLRNATRCNGARSYQMTRNHSISATFLFRRLQFYPNVLQLPNIVPNWISIIFCSPKHMCIRRDQFLYSWFLYPDRQPRAWILSGSLTIVAFP
uniref:Uncharacterized protein n=1 Tax=Hyaloperonospora arabidopsidis (strain Emoy2) TaxID=559515 RepID=M4BI26_HYAAE